MALYTVSITDGTTLSSLSVSAGRGPKGDGWTGVTYDNNTGRFTFTSTDGLGYVSDSITADLDTAVTDAEAAQAAAEAAQAATENIFDQFGDQYLGPKASDPTVDNDGDPLTEGDIYFNTTDDVLKFYSGSAWVAPESIATTAANEAEASATAAATSETNAASSASAASTSETNAASSASAASTSETNAATSETNAASSASAASTSETSAAASETAAAASETAAAASETAAATSESNAASSASAASTSASNAATSESNAASSASAASTSETNAANSASAAASSYDQFDDRYLGSKASAPTVDNDGNALLTGALYWDSTLGGLYVWNGTSWEIAGQRDELLQAVGATIADTAVDVFVYDTSKDSDGGAWRKRTQGTSWYNETLNTATRGSRKEFPSVAVIVAEADKVTIYDGDDPDLPMWMVFNTTSNPWSTTAKMLNSSNGITSVTGLNGKVPVGSTINGFYMPSFIDDTGYSYRSVTGFGYGRFNGGIAERNNNIGYTSLDGNLNPVNDVNNDVAITVLPNAPIDAATGLPVPTIAVATDGGVSVIKDDGTVVSGGEANSSWYVWRIMFDADNRVWARHTNNFSPSAQLMSEPPYTSVNNIGVGTEGYQLIDQSSTVFGRNTSWPFALGNFTDSVPQGFASTKDSLCIGASNGFTRIYDEASDRSKSMVAYTTSTYNTGWMNGDIKLATLSDTDDTDVTGSELVTNGTFDTDTSGWGAVNDAVLSVDTNRLKVTNNVTDYGSAYQDITTVAGKTYVVTLDFELGTSSRGRLSISVAGGAVIFAENYTADGSYNATFVAGTTSTRIQLINNETADTSHCLFDNVSVRLAEEDRSVNGNGLQVFGTVTKTPVATGADLVAYSGFSASNYLEQPYNSDLDFGTGDFCVMGWVKTNVQGTDVILGRYEASSTAPDWDIRIDLNEFMTFVVDSVTKLQGTTNLQTDTWVLFAVVRDSGTATLYINGKQESSASITTDLTNTSAKLGVGGRVLSTAELPFAGSLALLRISATAPTAEQIAKIYNDEKVLFQENAQATLYGSSDAVTALAYDDSTELLHVGTSAGRSDFQGLRRVNNTTNAVGAAISASNGMIVEE